MVYFPKMNAKTIHILRNALTAIIGYNAVMKYGKEYDCDCAFGIEQGCNRIMDLIKKLEREN